MCGKKAADSIFGYCRRYYTLYFRYCGQMSLALLSDVFGVSESYIARLFKVNKGSTVSEYVNGVKIAAACDRLTADHTPIGKISDSLGFYNAYYFSRVFKKIVGVTPSQFRRNAREIL